MKVGTIYFKNLDTGRKEKATLTDEKYIDVEVISPFILLKNFFIDLYYLWFKNNKCTEQQKFEKVVNIFNIINEDRVKENIPRINIEECYVKQERADYIQ